MTMSLKGTHFYIGLYSKIWHKLSWPSSRWVENSRSATSKFTFRIL